MAKLKKPRRRLPRRKPAVELLQNPQPQNLLAKEPGLLEKVGEGLKNLLSPDQQSPTPVAADSSPASSTISESPALLPLEIEAKLAAVPDVIGEQPPPDLSVAPEADLTNQARIAELAALGYVDAAFMAELLDDNFAALADRFGSDHWKLSTKQRDRLALPVAAILNGMFQYLFDWLPDFVGDTASEHPEYPAAATTGAAILIPRVVKQYRISKQRHGADGAARVAQSGGSGLQIPTATGAVGK